MGCVVGNPGNFTCLIGLHIKYFTSFIIAILDRKVSVV